MNLKDLSQIDIKNIDLNQVKDTVQKKPEILINFLLIVATLFVIIYLFNGQQKKSKVLKNSISQMKKRLDVVKTKEIIEKEKNEFVKAFPKTIPNDKLIDKLSEFAMLHDVQVVSFLPAKQKSTDFINYTTVTLTVSATEYQNITQFIKAIEESSYSIRVERWRGGMSDSRNIRRRNIQEAETQGQETIEAELEIGSLQLK